MNYPGYALACPIDASSADERAETLRELVDATAGDEVFLDCRGMRADNAGARMLLAADASARRSGKRLVLVGAKDRTGLLAELIVAEP